MYSPALHRYVQQLGNYAQVAPESIELLQKTLACFVAVLGKAINASTEPQGDFLDISVRLLLLSDGLANLPRDGVLDGAHYLVGLGLEQVVEPVARLGLRAIPRSAGPLENDLWYGLSLAFLHYLAGGYRVQALSVFRCLERMTVSLREGEYGSQYQDALDSLRALYSFKKSSAKPLRGVNVWYDSFSGQSNPRTPQELRIQQLAHLIRQRRDAVLANLGEDNEAYWLSTRGLNSDDATDFWRNYLRGLDQRGITAFTKEQEGPEPGFVWLQPGNDLLVVLPTGSGKTIIGELRTALALAQGKQVVWTLPTRALVRQSTADLRKSFEQLGITVEELPTTEDFIPFFAEGFEQPRHIAVTTPEKLASLLRYDNTGGVVQNIGLVVFDEAHTLLSKTRGATAELVLQKIRHQVPSCDIVLMSAFADDKDALEQFLVKLGRDPGLLVSDARPTRRIYGVITNDDCSTKQHPAVLLYPPGIQVENATTSNPFRLILNERLPSKPSPTATAQQFVRATAKAGLRTVLFVNRPDSAETQALRIAGATPDSEELAQSDCARLRIELGRTSEIEKTGSKGVACHHAGLTPLEQTFVEKWMHSGAIKTVVATPTLAQGVNLPFDVSIVTYVTRRNDIGNEPLSPSEILNMLGRAGRAGYVSDGLGLVSVKRSPGESAIRVLDRSRRFFFHPQEPSREPLGLSRLVTNAIKAKVSESDWVVELGDLDFWEVQSLVAFVHSVAIEADNVSESLVNQLESFPSIQQLNERKKGEVVAVLRELADNIQRNVSDGDPALTAVLRRTGMPVEILGYFLSQLRSIRLPESSLPEQMQWADPVVQTSLKNCSSRKWYARLMNDVGTGVNLETIFSTISLWRSGAPIVEIEKKWQSDKIPEKQSRIKVGKFLNHRLSAFAQFWGALAVCYEELFGLYATDMLGLLLRRLPVFVREGVSSWEQLEWLHAIGDLDRVLAHQLSHVGLTGDQGSIRSQVRSWKRGNPIPRELDEQCRLALGGALDLSHYD